MKQYLTIGFLLLSLFGFSQIKELNPSSVSPLDLSIEGEKAFIKRNEEFKKIEKKLSEGIKYENLTETEKKILESIDETASSYWSILGDGCSWYCGGGPNEVTASSYLKSQGENNYEPKNAHDLDYKNAWAEGVPGYGIGEFLLYTFEGASPRITEIKVVNGYVKSQVAWENNSRVKKLKVYFNNKPFAILNLQDIRGVQTFKFDPIGNGDRLNFDLLKQKPDWTLKFEIIDVYKGLKYDDVVISEIYFDGIDVHCLAKGTQILMFDKTTKNIEDLNIGDSVVYLTFENKVLNSAKIEKLEKVYHHNLVTYRFESGREITATQDHPFRIQDKGWASLKPDKSQQYKGFENINKIVVGDLFLTIGNSEKLIAIDFLKEELETYTISSMSSGDHFIANGFIVGIEKIK